MQAKPHIENVDDFQQVLFCSKADLDILDDHHLNIFSVNLSPYYQPALSLLWETLQNENAKIDSARLAARLFKISIDIARNSEGDNYKSQFAKVYAEWEPTLTKIINQKITDIKDINKKIQKLYGEIKGDIIYDEILTLAVKLLSLEEDDDKKRKKIKKLLIFFNHRNTSQTTGEIHRLPHFYKNGNNVQPLGYQAILNALTRDEKRASAKTQEKFIFPLKPHGMAKQFLRVGLHQTAYFGKMEYIFNDHDSARRNNFFILETNDEDEIKKYTVVNLANTKDKNNSAIIRAISIEFPTEEDDQEYYSGAFPPAKITAAIYVRNGITLPNKTFDLIDNIENCLNAAQKNSAVQIIQPRKNPYYVAMVIGALSTLATLAFFSEICSSYVLASFALGSSFVIPILPLSLGFVLGALAFALMVGIISGFLAKILIARANNKEFKRVNETSAESQELLATILKASAQGNSIQRYLEGEIDDKNAEKIFSHADYQFRSYNDYASYLLNDEPLSSYQLSSNSSEDNDKKTSQPSPHLSGLK